MGFKLKHKLARDALWQYARRKNQPVTLDEMLANAILLNGKKLKHARSCGPKNGKSFGQVLKRDPRFEIVGQVVIESFGGIKKQVSLWALVKDDEWHNWLPYKMGYVK
tara:strand:+ start:4023 stop:4346 length:324 start_codon:yes stop_codon:yes gene_type:complete